MAKAKTHQITIEDVDSYFITRQMAGSFGKYEHKELVLNVKGKIVSYHVYNQGSLVLSTTSLEDAVERYNEI